MHQAFPRPREQLRAERVGGVSRADGP